jgi:hypothetical protein
MNYSGGKSYSNENQKPQRPLQIGLPSTTTSISQKPTEPIPDDFDAFLAHVWKYRAYYRNLSTGEFYEQVYKASATKSDSQTYNQKELVQLGELVKGIKSNNYTTSDTNPETKGTIDRGRVYVNVHAQYAGVVFGYIVTNIVPIQGVLYAKVADPTTARTARDVIVIYISEQAPNNTEQQVILALSQYQSSGRNAQQFVDEVPRLTKRQILGVSTGDEPPNLVGEGKNDLNKLIEQHLNRTRDKEGGLTLQLGEDLGLGSFSTYRSLLIHTALTEAPDSNQPNSFKQLVWQYFNEGGISQSNPSKQGKVTSGKILELTGMLK